MSKEEKPSRMVLVFGIIFWVAIAVAYFLGYKDYCKQLLVFSLSIVIPVFIAVYFMGGPKGMKLLGKPKVLVASNIAGYLVSFALFFAPLWLELKGFEKKIIEGYWACFFGLFIFWLAIGTFIARRKIKAVLRKQQLNLGG